MKNYLSLFLVMSCLGLVSCGSPQSTAKLEVTSAFSIPASGFPGGLIIVGENAVLGKKFSVALTAGFKTSISLDQGDWKFAAVGWNGPQNFMGDTYCGTTTSNLSTTSATVNLDLKTANCVEPAFVAEINMRALRVKTCGAFYERTTGTTYGPITQPNFCETLPPSLHGKFQYHRFFAINAETDKPGVEGFYSPCSISVAPFPIVPTKKIPLAIKFYPSQAECELGSPKGPLFVFKGGIQGDQSADFDKEYLSALDLLVLPSGDLKRGRSPFMDMIPEMLCGSGEDCFPDPNPLPNTAYVPWNNNSNNIYFGPKNDGSLCPGPQTIMFLNVMNTSYDARVGRCMGHIFRNELTCQEPISYQNVQDVEYFENKIYILHGAGAQKISVLDANVGSLLNEVPLPSSNFTAIAVGQNSIYAINPGEVHRAPRFGGSPFNLLITNSGFTDVAVNPQESHVYVIQGGNVKIYDQAFNYYNSIPFTTSSPAKVKATNQGVYLLAKPLALSTLVYYPVNNFYTPGTAESKNISAYEFEDLAININDIVLVSSSRFEKFDLMSFTQLISSTYPGNMVRGLGYSGDKIFLGSSSSGVRVHVATSGLPQMSRHDGECEDNVVFNGQNILLQTKANPIFDIFNDALDLFGRKTLANKNIVYEYFPTLAHRDHEGSGKLRRVQELLGPDGIGGVFHNKTCPQLVLDVTQAGATGVQKTISLFDHEDGSTEKILISVKSGASTPQGSYICNDTDPNNMGCAATPFDLLVRAKKLETNDPDEIYMKLKCGKKLGNFESYEENPIEVNKDYITWNTQSIDSMRFEHYEYRKTSIYIDSEMTKAVKSGPDSLRTRTIAVSVDSGSGNANVNVSEWMKSASSIGLSKFSYQDNFMTTTTGTIKGVSFTDLRNQTEFGSTPTMFPHYCMYSPTTNPFGTSTGGCPNFTSIGNFSSNTLSIPMNAQSFLNDGTAFEAKFQPPSFWVNP